MYLKFDSTRILGPIATAILVVALLSGCVPAVGSPSSPVAEISSSIGNSWTASVNALVVEYHHVEQLDLADDPGQTRAGILFEETPPDTCTITLAHRWVTAEHLAASDGSESPASKREAQTSLLASALAYCHYQLNDVGSTDANQQSREWAALYMEQCGPILQPLGMPVEDGTCPLPPFGEATS